MVTREDISWITKPNAQASNKGKELEASSNEKDL